MKSSTAPAGEIDVPRLAQAIAVARASVASERTALERLAGALDEASLANAFGDAVALIVRARGRVVVTGVGKSGIIGRKIAGTLASTGTPAVFLHAADAGHGDLGVIAPDDIVLALSWSGESGELAHIFRYCNRLAVPLIVITGGPDSSAAKAADVCLTLPTVTEAGPNQLVPTSSAIVQLALGDGLAMAIAGWRGFSPSDFHALHPGGPIGWRLRPLASLMSTGLTIPRVRETASVLEAAVEMTRKRFGCTAIVDEAGRMLGIFTDGDLRRSLLHGALDDPVRDHVNENPLTAEEELLACDALTLLSERRVSVLFVLRKEELIGIVHLQDLLNAGVA